MSENASQGVVLITGASGLIGTRLCMKLGETYQLIGLDLNPPRDPRCRSEFIQTDLTDDENTRSSFEEIKERFGPRLTSVVHLAAYYDFSGEPSPLYDELTVEGTRRVLRNLHELQFEVEQFVFSSTLLVMKPNDRGGHISELSATEPKWAYPQSKLKTEEVIRNERGKIPAVILRIAGVYDEHCHSLPISQQIARIYEQQVESHFFPGDKTHGQAFVHLDDLAECIEKVIERRQWLEPYDVYLIAEPDVMSYDELQHRLGELIHGTEWTTLWIPKSVAKVGAWVQDKLSNGNGGSFIKPWMVDLADDHYAAVIAHARTRLAWDPKHRLRDTLPKIVEFLKRDPREFYDENGLPLPEESFE